MCVFKLSPMSMTTSYVWFSHRVQHKGQRLCPARADQCTSCGHFCLTSCLLTTQILPTGVAPWVPFTPGLGQVVLALGLSEMVHSAAWATTRVVLGGGSHVCWAQAKPLCWQHLLLPESGRPVAILLFTGYSKQGWIAL